MENDSQPCGTNIPSHILPRFSFQNYFSVFSDPVLLVAPWPAKPEVRSRQVDLFCHIPGPMGHTRVVPEARLVVETLEVGGGRIFSLNDRWAGRTQHPTSSFLLLYFWTYIYSTFGLALSRASKNKKLLFIPHRLFFSFCSWFHPSQSCSSIILWIGCGACRREGGEYSGDQQTALRDPASPLPWVPGESVRPSTYSFSTKPPPPVGRWRRRGVWGRLQHDVPAYLVYAALQFFEASERKRAQYLPHPTALVPDTYNPNVHGP